ncbi:hypothetical protein M885DRAFT_523162 [Pelagophyceae sp. CCMP2097]|nr:hypothetical protein M885DRAFT_523162 [Pelagophyceae sp. CCMP2097]
MSDDDAENAAWLRGLDRDWLGADCLAIKNAAKQVEKLRRAPSPRPSPQQRVKARAVEYDRLVERRGESPSHVPHALRFANATYANLAQAHVDRALRPRTAPAYDLEEFSERRPRTPQIPKVQKTQVLQTLEPQWVVSTPKPLRSDVVLERRRRRLAAELQADELYRPDSAAVFSTLRQTLTQTLQLSQSTPALRGRAGVLDGALSVGRLGGAGEPQSPQSPQSAQSLRTARSPARCAASPSDDDDTASFFGDDANEAVDFVAANVALQKLRTRRLSTNAAEARAVLHKSRLRKNAFDAAAAVEAKEASRQAHLQRRESRLALQRERDLVESQVRFLLPGFIAALFAKKVHRFCRVRLASNRLRFRRKRAAKVIQRQHRFIFQARLEPRLEAFKAVLRAPVARKAFWMRRRKTVDTFMRFLEDFRHSMAGERAISRFLDRVKKAQKLARSFTACQDSRRRTLWRLCLKLEAEERAILAVASMNVHAQKVQLRVDLDSRARDARRHEVEMGAKKSAPFATRRQFSTTSPLLSATAPCLSQVRSAPRTLSTRPALSRGMASTTVPPPQFKYLSQPPQFKYLSQFERLQKSHATQTKQSMATFARMDAIWAVKSLKDGGQLDSLPEADAVALQQRRIMAPGGASLTRLSSEDIMKIILFTLKQKRQSHASQATLARFEALASLSSSVDALRYISDDPAPAPAAPQTAAWPAFRCYADEDLGPTWRSVVHDAIVADLLHRREQIKSRMSTMICDGDIARLASSLHTAPLGLEPPPAPAPRGARPRLPARLPPRPASSPQGASRARPAYLPTSMHSKPRSSMQSRPTRSMHSMRSMSRNSAPDLAAASRGRSMSSFFADGAETRAALAAKAEGAS